MSLPPFPLAIALFVIACVPALPATIDITAMNNTGGEVFDVHVLISGTGGTIHNLTAVSPAVQALDAGSGSAAGSEVNGSWTPGLANGGTWEATFDVDFSDLVVQSAYWTDAAHNPVADIPAANVHLNPTPEPASGSLATGALLLLASRLFRKGERK